MTMNIAQRCHQVFRALFSPKSLPPSIRDVAQETGIPKSSVHRHKQTIEKRQQYPESHLWETVEGVLWLGRLLWATIYCFGIKQGIGSDSLSEFFHLLRLERHLGVSADSLRKQEVKIKAQISAYEQEQNQKSQPNQPIEICAGNDEVYFGNPILVMLELSSGFILIETAAANRQYETWQEQAEAALPPNKFHCRQMVSDSAKALIKLALKGLDCQWTPDLFHLLWNCGKPFGAAIGRQLGQLNKQIGQVQSQLEKAQQQGNPPQALAVQMAQLQQQHEQIENAQQTYRAAMHQISTLVHPFRLDGLGFQTALSLQAALAQPLQTLQTLAQSLELVKATTALETFKKNIPAVVMNVNGWWSWVNQALEIEAAPPEVSNWLVCAMLPWVYWNQQADKTKRPELRCLYQQAAEQAYLALLSHPLTATLTQQEQERWWIWSMWMVAKFQRTSSAVEGRNGYLSRLHHASRGLDPQTLNILTIIHNYDLKRADGTTAAQRLFGQPFPDLFEWVVEHMGEVPQPRKSRKSAQPQMPTLQAVPL
jgi:hypothetical protein